MTESRFTVLEDRGVLAVAGSDRATFLQGLVSNDTTRVGAGYAVYAALLTPQGKYLHDFIMVEHGDAIWLDCEAARLDDLKRRLAIYRLRSKVTLDALPDLAVAAIFGAALQDLPGELGAARPFGNGVGFTDPRLAALCARAILPRATIRQTLDATGAAETGFAEYDRLRLGLGIPDGSRDLVLDKSILLEAGFDELHGVDWQKGCYMGQELTARTKYRGLVKKRLFPVKIEGPTPGPGTLVMLDGKEAGEMRSSRDELGLALLQLAAVSSPRLVAGEAGITPVAPDWMHLADD